MRNQLETTYHFQTTLPEYQFRSTSTCTPVVGYTSYTATEQYSPMANAPRPGQIRRDGWNEEPDDDPVGQLTVSPVGDVPMAMMILLMVVYLLKKTKIFIHKNL